MSNESPPSFVPVVPAAPTVTVGPVTAGSVIPGKAIVISGPSGAGKSTLVDLLFLRRPDLVKAVSATTRPPRDAEKEGEHYFFLSQEEFAARRQRGEFLEVFEVFGRGDWYGTLRSEVAPRLAAGKSVVLEVDVHGMQAIRREYPDAVTIFVRPVSLSELERRLRARKTDSEDAIRRRLAEAERELAVASAYGHQVINDDLDRAVQQICEILSPGEGAAP